MRGGRFKQLILLLALGAGLASLAPLAAQDYTISRTVCLPAVYYVGDEVEMRLGIRSDFAGKMAVPQTITQPSWGTIGNIQILPREDEIELRLQFTCYVAGTHSLPAINVGPVVLEGINIFVTSLAPPTGGLEPLREQAAMPGTWLRVLLQAAIVIVIPLVLILFVWWGWPRVRNFRQLRQEQKPHRRILRNLAAGRLKLVEMDSLQFYTWVLGEVRQYLAERWQAPALAATTSELAELVYQRIHHAETAEALLAVFAHGDRVKFADEPASSQSCLNDLGTIDAAIAHIEQEERMRRRALFEAAPEPVLLAGRELGRQVRETLRPRGKPHAGL